MWVGRNQWSSEAFRSGRMSSTLYKIRSIPIIWGCSTVVPSIFCAIEHWERSLLYSAYDRSRSRLQCSCHRSDLVLRFQSSFELFLTGTFAEQRCLTSRFTPGSVHAAVRRLFRACSRDLRRSVRESLSQTQSCPEPLNCEATQPLAVWFQRYI